MTRSPRSWLDPRAVRLAAFAAFAVLGSLQWVRYVDGASAGRALLWSAAAVVCGALVLAAGRRPLALTGAAVLGAALAVGAAGLDLTYLEPDHVDELGAGIYRGVEALNTVKLPYEGSEPWVLTTMELAGAAICWLAAVLACWPGGRGRLVALALLLVMVAAPVVSLGADKPAALGLGLAILVAGFVWVERLARRPGLGLAVLVAGVALVAVPVGRAADREEPWFDYKAFSETLTGADPVRFDWEHEYGPIDWDREGAELFRVDTAQARYWKVETLNTFDGRLWESVPESDLGEAPEDDLPFESREQWETEFSVSVRALESDQFVGAGTTLSISDSTQEVAPALVPGQWVVPGTEGLGEGDSYTARAYIPQPKPEELAEATVGADIRRLVSLELNVDLIRPLHARLSGIETPIALQRASVRVRPFGDSDDPVAHYPQVDRSASGVQALERSDHARTWALAQRLRRGAESPYEYVVAVNNHLRDPTFRYTETPPPVPAGKAPLDAFLFDTKRGHCQQFSGAMALLLRMGGVPARVATGFSPGGQRESGEWVIRDTDAHSWVEAWFDGIGWVTFDPTPPATPARSQVAAIDLPGSDAPSPGSDAASGSGSALEPRRPIPGAGFPGSSEATFEEEESGFPWLPVAAALALLLVAGLLLARRAGRRASTPQGALAELERALRRAGRAAPPGTTLSALERSLGAAPGGYLGALRAARYAASAPVPDPSQRRAFRRDLAGALGRGGWLRALYALPPTLPTRVGAAGPSSSADRATAS